MSDQHVIALEKQVRRQNFILLVIAGIFMIWLMAGAQTEPAPPSSDIQKIMLVDAKGEPTTIKLDGINATINQTFGNVPLNLNVWLKSWPGSALDADIRTWPYKPIQIRN